MQEQVEYPTLVANSFFTEGAGFSTPTSELIKVHKKYVAPLFEDVQLNQEFSIISIIYSGITNLCKYE